jgi:hypothetical protein
MKYLDDFELTNFLKTYQPSPPLESDDFEENLFNLIEKEPQFTSQKFSSKLMLPGAIAAGLMLVLGGSYFLKPSPQIAENYLEIEEFLVNSWEHTLEGKYLNHYHTPEGEWLTLTNFKQ